MGGKVWTKNQEEQLKEMYLNGTDPKDIAKKLDRTENAVYTKAYKLGISSIIIKPNNPKFKAVYQDYDWCYERYINRGMTMQEMADEAGMEGARRTRRRRRS